MAYSYVQYTGNGATTNYAFSFPYLDSSHIKVRVDGVITSFTFVNSGTVQISPAPLAGKIIDIRRETPKDIAPVNFTDGSVLLEQDLDLLAAFNLYTAQESADGVADAIVKDTTGVWDAQSRRIKSLADPVNANDAVNKTWAETAMSSQLAQATTQASNAATSATSAASSASTATTQAGTATTKANEASSSATAAASSASSASSSASTATTKASQASTSATNAANSATAAATSATNAASSATSSANNATAAATSASNALSSANSAAASFDAFDDRYLGTKSSAPTVDNDGNALVIGAMYYSSTATDMFVWNGSAWVTVSSTTSATNAANSASAAATSATNAANSASSASTSATNAANSATAASGSASTANSAASTATNQATSATTSASSASTSASNAATSATQASTSASAAATSASQASAVALGNEPVRHSVRPSLLLDFANTKALDPRITFTRGSTGTYYDGKTVAKAEENLLQQSQTFDNSYWTGTDGVSSITANTSIAPDGTTTAETFVENTGAGAHGVRTINGVSITSGLTYTASAFIKAATRQYAALVLWTGSDYEGVVVDLSAGTITATNGTLSSSSITSVGNGWYRVVITRALPTTSTYFGIFLSDSATPTFTVGRPSYTGNGTGSILAWGAQLEQRSSVTAYTATTTAPITNYIPALQTAASGVARFEHNPVTGESLGLEIEEQRTNLYTYSSNFENGVWTKETGATITQDQVVSPDGTLNADVLNGTTNGSSTYQLLNLSTVGTYTFSVFAKYVSGLTTINLQLGGSAFGAQQEVRFNTTTGELVSNVSSLSFTVTPVGNGWFRYTVTRATTASGTAFMDINTTGVSQFALWGAQLEAGSFATSYIPTVASQVTRSADDVSMTGTNFSSWFRVEEGTAYIETSRPYVTIGSTVRPIWRMTSGSSANLLGIEHYANVIQAEVRTQSDSSYVDLPYIGVPSANSIIKNGMAYKLNDVAAVANGGTVATDTSATMPVGVNNLAFSTLTTQTIKKFAYYPRRLTNAELQGLTTV